MQSINQKLLKLEKDFESINWKEKLWYLDKNLVEIVNLRKHYEENKHNYDLDDIKLGLKFYKKISIQLGNIIKNKELYYEENPDYDLDIERKILTRAVIHHTARPDEIDLTELNGLQLLRLYLPYFQNPKWNYYGKVLTSSHFSSEGYPVFYAYHYLIRFNGEIIKLLDPIKNIGWHAGNWKINCRSVGICLDGDFVESHQNDPTKEQIQSINEIINELKINNIIPHYKANPNTTCPGKWYEKYF